LREEEPDSRVRIFLEPTPSPFIFLRGGSCRCLLFLVPCPTVASEHYADVASSLDAGEAKL
jgi:hypothetical protein